MPDFSTTFRILFGFTAFLLILAWLSRQISIHIQLLAHDLTRSTDLTTVALFLLFLPGVIIHEGAHWGAAKLFGLKTSKFRVWPQKRGKQIILGSVTVQNGGPIVDALVGMAPLIVGTFLVALIGHRIFFAYWMADVLAQGRWVAALRAFSQALQAPDGALWAYLLFTIGNGMMPSPSDRAPLKPLAIYLLLALLLYLILGLPLNPFTTLMIWITPTFQDLSSALLFTILLDLAVLAVLVIVRLVFQSRVTFSN